MTDDRTMPRFKTSSAQDNSVVLGRSFLISQSGSAAGSVYTLLGESSTVGRDLKAKICIPDLQASRVHANFSIVSGKCHVEDLGSTNGTFVNGNKLSSKIELHEGDEVLIGTTLFKFTYVNPLDGGRVDLCSHGYFENRLTEELDRTARYNRPLSIMMIGFSKSSDEDLKSIYPQVVMRIKKMIRAMDLFGHYGKYELELLLPETNQEEATLLANRIVNEVQIKGAQLNIALASFPQDGRSRDVLIEKSREALRIAKQKSKSFVYVQKEDSQNRHTLSNANVVVKNEKMKLIYSMIEKIAKSSITVLINGETGVGKEVIAESLHQTSDRKNKQLISFNCAALTETLLESELFGHEKGAFTGADNTKVGLFETAHGGTIFLDEVGEMSLKTQAKLLRVLQNKKVMRVGSNKEIDIDVRVVAATNKNLEELVKKNLFREDLMYRLNAHTIDIPPLRERKEEIPFLVQTFLEKVCKENELELKQITPQAMDMLISYSWPGNIRELKNVIERSVIISEGQIIDVDSFAGRMGSIAQSLLLSNPNAQANSPFDQMPSTKVADMKDVMGEYEKQLIINALNRTQWNQTKASTLLQIPRRTLVSKIKKYGITRG